MIYGNNDIDSVKYLTNEQYYSAINSPKHKLDYFLYLLH